MAPPKQLPEQSLSSGEGGAVLVLMYVVMNMFIKYTLENEQLDTVCKAAA